MPMGATKTRRSEYHIAAHNTNKATEELVRAARRLAFYAPEDSWQRAAATLILGAAGITRDDLYTGR
jgi:hypothetical protein